MSISVAAAPATVATPTGTRNPAMFAGACLSFLFAIFQVSAIWWSPRAIAYFGGPARLSTQRPLVYAGLCLAFAVIVALFGLYALSGAGRIRRLPLLRTGLIAITAIYLLRGLLAVPQAPIVLRHPEFVRFLIFSVISLCIGVVHAWGLIHLYRHGRPGDDGCH